MKELVFVIDRNSTTPLYLQIYNYIKTQIVEGQLKENTKLPSIRKLADTLQVSRNTLQLAYEQLQAEGYIRSENKKGYYIQAALPDMPWSIEQKKKKSYDKSPEDGLLDFRAGAVDGDNFPIIKWRSLSNRVLQEPFLYKYGENQGDLDLRESLADYLFQSRGVKATGEQIVIGSSTQQLLMVLSLILKNDHNRIAVEDPGYNGARELFSLQNFSIHPIPVTEKGIDLTLLEKSKATLVYVTPSHQFPLGITMPINERMSLLNWADEVKGYILEDDYDSEFRYKHQPIPSLQGLTSSNRVIYLSTFSKALLPSIRISYMVLPEDLLHRYCKIAPLLEQTASSIHQRTLHYFIEEGYWHAHLRKMRQIYKRKMNLICNTLLHHFKDSVIIKGNLSGLYVVIELKTKKSEDYFIQKAFESGIKVYPCSVYYANGSANVPTIQLGFANLKDSEIIEGINRLALSWKMEF